MAGTKGEKIVTILCGAWVTPAKDGVWPEGWMNLTQHMEPVKREEATVMGVFLRDGSVYLLLKNILDDKLAESPAVGWKVTALK